jgi:hypothetical protein
LRHSHDRIAQRAYTRWLMIQYAIAASANAVPVARKVTATEHEFVDAYAKAHAAKYGEDFVIN